MRTDRGSAWFAAALLALAACDPPQAAKPAAADDDAWKKGAAVHPLDPLTYAELQTAVEVLKASGKFAEGMFLPTLVLHEPSKEGVRAWTPGTPLKREAFAVVLDRQGRKTSEAVVDLAKKAVVTWTEIPGAQPNVLNDEFESVPEIIKEDKGWRDALAKRGITDVSKVHLDTWAAGVLPVEGAAPGARLCRAIAFHKGEDKNVYGRPIEGLVAVVDVKERKVVQVVDTGVRPLAKKVRDLDAKALGPARPALKRLSVEQPDGPGFSVDGQQVRWDKWRFRFAMHPREGLVLYTVGYEDKGKVRPILHRASISEMVVPYGDPDINWVWRAAFDEGEYGLGRLANELEEGTDAPANARYVDAVMSDEKGAPDVWRNAVALYERDGGILWKHYDEVTERSYLRRARQLVAMYMVTVGNYDYFIHWIFNQDGSIEVRAEASGILLAKGVAQDTCQSCADAAKGKPAEGDERTGTLVAERIVAPNHQHFFSFRLDFDVDGPRNSVAEVNAASLPAGAENPHHNGFQMVKTPLATELAARRDMSLATHRHWKVYNPGVKTALGHYPSYLLVPGENSVPYAQGASTTRKRAAFIEHHLWATAYKAEELSAAGNHPNQNPASDGLPKFTADDEAIEDRDLVLWYTVGLTHGARPEEWPVMTTAGMSFKLVPAGFFTENPALDIPEDAAEEK